MSDLSCPVCSAPFREVLREGILIDVCTQCRGVWLDRGELEKLLSMARDGGEEPQRKQPVYEQPRETYSQRPQDYRPDDDDDYKRRGGQYDQHGHKRKKKGFDFADIFDFGD